MTLGLEVAKVAKRANREGSKTDETDDRPTGRQYRQPRLAEMIAGELRDRILSGEYAEGGMLPRQEDLLDMFNVSPPSLRGALQVLETEGLITVLRGSIGGAVVHAPEPRAVAYNVGLVLQARQTQLSDVALALENLEPVCVQMCAARPDRGTTVVPVLRELQKETLLSINDIDHLAKIARRFHEELVDRCGNQTLILIVGALEKLWSAHEEAWIHDIAQDGEEPSAETIEMNALAHQQIIDAISDGDVENAGTLATNHLRTSQRHRMAAPDVKVQSSLLRG